MRAGELLHLGIEKAAAGGRMLARHQGRVVLVSGAIPGERVTARLERVTSAVAFAEAVAIEEPSPDRQADRVDLRCGGCAFAHITYERQLRLKQEIVQDAFARIAHAPMPVAPVIASSPQRGYRMRARLHASRGRLGFFREGSHELCDAAATGQLADATVEWIARASSALSGLPVEGLAGLELAETLTGRERVCHLDLHAGVDAAAFRALAFDVAGLSAQLADRAAVVVLAGSPAITDLIHVGDAGAPAVTLRRDVRAFFQSNRFLIDALSRHVAALVPQGPVVDLYAGVGLFGLALAASRSAPVTLVEGDPVSAADLAVNAAPYANADVRQESVEAFVAGPRFPTTAADATLIVDPPRTGLSKAVAEAVVASLAPRLVYVSCDPATLARDSRRLLDAGYQIADVALFDMFPNTAHIESVVSYVRT